MTTYYVYDPIGMGALLKASIKTWYDVVEYAERAVFRGLLQSFRRFGLERCVVKRLTSQWGRGEGSGFSCCVVFWPSLHKQGCTTIAELDQLRFRTIADCRTMGVL